MPPIRVGAGRRFASGQSEICAGSKLVGRFANVRVGETLRFANRDWKVVCNFTAGGSAFESEIWGENEQFMGVFRRETFQSVTFRLKDPGSFEALCAAIGSEGEVVSGNHSWLLADPDAFGEVMTNVVAVAKLAHELEDRDRVHRWRRRLLSLGRR